MTTVSNRRCFSIPTASNVLNNHLTITITNEALVEDYLSWKQSYTQRAHIAYRIWVVRFQSFANKPPELLNHTDYVAFANQIAGQFAPRCVEFALNIVHNYLRYFAEQGRLRFPMYLVRVPRATSRSHAAISEKEYRSILAQMRTITPLPLRDLSIIMLLHDTGLRIGELLSLHVEDIGDDKSAVIKTEKTTRFRRVFWNQDTDATLHSYLVERVNHGPTGTDHLFTTNRADSTKAISYRSVERMLKRHLKSANITTRNLCLHSFRHGFIHRLAKLGVPDAIIAQLVGHSTPFTISHYTKLSRPEFREFAEKQLAFADDGIELEKAA